MKETPLFDTSPRFDGATYVPAVDHARLSGQLARVYEVMRSGQWLTLDDISNATGDPAASVSAQLRHLRKKRFGANTVEKRRRTATGGEYQYRVIVDSAARAGEIQ
jgi:hypothetical protein